MDVQDIQDICWAGGERNPRITGRQDYSGNPGPKILYILYIHVNKGTSKN